MISNTSSAGLVGGFGPVMSDPDIFWRLFLNSLFFSGKTEQAICYQRFGRLQWKERDPAGTLTRINRIEILSFFCKVIL